MITKRLILFMASFVLLTFGKAQNKKTDSLLIIKTLKLVLAACNNNDPADPKVKTAGRYYKAAPYIVYRGSDKIRAWKDFVNYANADEKDETDHICKRINRTINSDNNYKIIKYFTEKESEGIWHVLIVSYNAEGTEKKVAMAFLKIGNKFGLGDIDQNYSK